MKRMKKALAMLLVMVMVLSLTACGSKKNELVGTWQAKIDMTELIIGEADAGLAEVLASMDCEVELNSIGDYVDAFEPVWIFVFNEDGSYSLTVDEASLCAELESYKAGLEGYFRYFFAELLSQTLVDLGVVEQVNSEEELEAILGVSLDEAITESMGMELGDYVNQVIDEELGGSAEIAEMFNSEGKYKAKDGKLWLSAGLEYNVDVELYDYYSISGNTLTIEVGTAGQEDETAMLYPLVFQKTA